MSEKSTASGKRRLYPLWIFLMGLANSLPFVFPQISLLAFVSAVPFCLLLFSEALYRPEQKNGRFIRWGFYYSMGYMLGVYHWFWRMYPLEFTGMGKGSALTVVLAAWIGLSLLATLSYMFAPHWVALVRRLAVVRRHPTLLALTYACAWTVLSFAQTFTFAGVPWGTPAVSQYPNLAVIQSASLLGNYFITFLILLVNGVLACGILAFLKEGSKKKLWRLSLSALCIFVANLLLGTVLLAVPRQTDGTLRAAVLQGNISSREKWDEKSHSRSEVIGIYADLAEKAAQEGATLMLWPETAVNYELLDAKNKVYQNKISAIAKSTGAIQVVGTFTARQTEEKSALYNSLVVFYPDGTVSEAVYSKRQLVPFGEYVPMRSLIETVIPPLTQLIMYSMQLTPGEDSQIIDTPAGALGGLICFDSIYSELARDSAADGAQVFLLSTNDSWFLDSAAVYQHNGQAVLRAVENGRAVLRSANTGVSSIITEKGEVLGEIPPLIDGYLVGEVSLSSDLTLYTRVGNIWVAVCFLFPFMLPGYDAFRRKQGKGT